MAEMIRLPDGSVSAVLCLRVFMELTGKWMGSEALAWLEGYLEDIRLDDRDVAELEKEIDRAALSAAAGRIGTICWRESNV